MRLFAGANKGIKDDQHDYTAQQEPDEEDSFETAPEDPLADLHELDPEVVFARFDITAFLADYVEHSFTRREVFEKLFQIDFDQTTDPEQIRKSDVYADSEQLIATAAVFLRQF